MAQQQNVQVDKKALKEAQALWNNFMGMTKKAIIFVVILLAILAYAFV